MQREARIQIINDVVVDHRESYQAFIGDRVDLEDDMDGFCVAVFGKHPEQMEMVD